MCYINFKHKKVDSSKESLVIYCHVTIILFDQLQIRSPLSVRFQTHTFHRSKYD